MCGGKGWGEGAPGLTWLRKSLLSGWLVSWPERWGRWSWWHQEKSFPTEDAESPRVWDTKERDLFKSREAERKESVYSKPHNKPNLSLFCCCLVWFLFIEFIFCLYPVGFIIQPFLHFIMNAFSKRRRCRRNLFCKYVVFTQTHSLVVCHLDSFRPSVLLWMLQWALSDLKLFCFLGLVLRRSNMNWGRDMNYLLTTTKIPCIMDCF